MKTKDLIEDGQALVGAKSRFDHAIPVYDDGFGPLWIHRDSLGISGIVRAQTWEDAYGICEDEFFPDATETIEEIEKEYGFDVRHAKIVNDNGVEREAVYPTDYPNGTLASHLTFVGWRTIETPNPGAWSDNPGFQEAFGFRPNGPNKVGGSGIYAKDSNGDYLDQLTPELVAELELTLEIEDEE